MARNEQSLVAFCAALALASGGNLTPAQASIADHVEHKAINKEKIKKAELKRQRKAAKRLQQPKAEQNDE